MENEQPKKRKNPWDDPEYRKRMSDARKKLWENPEYRQRRVEQLKQKWADPDFHEKMKAKARKVWTEERCKAHRELLNSPEVKAKQSASAKKYLEEHPERNVQNSEQAKKRFSDPNERKKTAEATKKAMQRDDVRERYLKGRETVDWETVYKKGSATRKRNWETMSEEEREKVRQHLFNAILKTGETSIEKKIREQLESASIPHKKQWYAKAEEYDRTFRFDFFLPNDNIIIEADGDYWHSFPEIIENDAKKDAFAKRRGIGIVHFKEHEINEPTFDVISRLEEYKRERNKRIDDRRS